MTTRQQAATGRRIHDHPHQGVGCQTGICIGDDNDFATESRQYMIQLIDLAASRRRHHSDVTVVGRQGSQGPYRVIRRASINEDDLQLLSRIFATDQIPILLRNETLFIETIDED